MIEVKLDPTVVQFKQFINNHPELIKVVRKEGRSWQEYYEKWALLGEDDPMWDKYKKVIDEGKITDHDFLNRLVTLKDYFDFNDIDKYINQLSKTIIVIQELLSNYKGSGDPPIESNKQLNSFNWFRD